MFRLVTISHARSVHPVYDDVIAIVADGGHGADATQPENRAGARVQFAHERTKKPDSTAEAVEDEHRKLRNHHAKVRKCQVDNEHIGWSFQIFCLRKEMENQRVSCN